MTDSQRCRGVAAGSASIWINAFNGHGAPDEQSEQDRFLALYGFWEPLHPANLACELAEFRRTLDSLGYAHHHLGQYAQAIACYQQAINTHGEAGDRRIRAAILAHLATSHLGAGDPNSGRHAWLEALAILDELHDPDANQIREKLAKLSTAVPCIG